MMKKPIRIIHVVGIMDYGGVESLIMNWYREIDRRHYQFDFIVHTTKKGKYDDEIISMGGKIYRVPQYRLKHIFAYQKAWRDLLGTLPDHQLIHGHIRSTAKIYSKLCHAFGKKVILHSHSTGENKDYKQLAKFLLKWRLTVHVDQCLACSEEAGRWLFKETPFLVLPQTIRLENYAFNLESRTKMRQQLGFTDELVLGHVGRFISQKNHEFFIALGRSVKESNKKIVFLLIGEGDMKKKFIKKINEEELSQYFNLIEPRRSIESYYHAMDIFLFPSIKEGLGMVAIEAQAAGLPVIASQAVPKETAVTTLIQYLSLDVSLWLSVINQIDEGQDKNSERRMCHQQALSQSSVGSTKGVTQLLNLYQAFLN